MEEYIKWSFERDRSVLLVVDLQNAFVLDGVILQVKEAKNQLPKVKRLIKECRELKLPIIYVRHETDPLYNPREIESFPMLKEKGIKTGTFEAEIVYEIAPEANDTIVTKRRFSAFYQTDLEIILKNIRGQKNPVDTVIICGAMTNICCESTARDAFYRDFKVIFGSDVCATTSVKAHNATLANMEIFGRVMDHETIIRLLKNGVG